MVDLHAHLLPGVDDGAATPEEAAAMCRCAASDGITTIVATPHQRHELYPDTDRATLEARLETVRAVAPNGLDLALGAEIRVDSDLLAEVDALPGGSLLPLAGSHYLLLDLPLTPVGPDPRALVHELTVAGWRPVLAHPERIWWLAADPAGIAGLVERGALVQLTAMSVTGGFGPRPKECSSFLLDADLVHFVASDAHDPVARPPVLSEAFRAVADGWGEERARRLTEDNPRAVLDDRLLGKDTP